VSEGELFRVETVDWTGGQIGDNDSAEDIKTVDLSQVRTVTNSVNNVTTVGMHLQLQMVS
jgi:formamidase